MKKLVITTSLISAILIIVTVYLIRKNFELKRIIVHNATISQMDAISARARAFMENHYDTDFINGGSSISGMRSYERTIDVPEDKKDEFTKWMSGYSVSPVTIEGYPSESGSDVTSSDKELIYRVYYGEEPDQWKDE